MAENLICKVDVCGCLCEVVEAGGDILLYVDGYLEGEIYEEETIEDYISQIREILE